MKASGASKSVVNQWLSGKIKSIDINYALAIERELGISHIWLMTGSGEPERMETLKLSSDEARLLSVYRRLEPRDQQVVLRLAETIAAEVEAAATQLKAG